LEAVPPNLEEVRDALVSVVRNGTRASDVIGRIRALIKKTPPRRDRFEINDAIREVIELTGNEAEKHGVSMRAQLAERLPLVEGDRVQLQQVVLNMVVNAIEAISPGQGGSRELLIVTDKGKPDGVLVSVKDFGPGLTDEFAARVFDAFYTTKSGGMGLGLSICRSIVEAHGGRVWAKPNSPQGAVFEFNLPTCNSFS
jgi:signal transduction histidine kinase